MIEEGSLARSLVTPGIREAEEWLLGELQALAEEARADPRKLAQTVRVIVPGGSLRELFTDRMVRALGGAVVGVRVQTLWSLALEVLEGAGAAVRTGAHLFELVARREVTREAVLRTALDGLEDGAGLAAGAISDLLSARLESAAPKAVAKALASLPREERERTTALVRAARATRAAMRALGRSRFADVYEEAARCLDASDPGLVPARALFVHGFSGATGQAAAFLAALLRRSPACLLVVEPPSGEGGEDGDALAPRLSRRLVGTTPTPVATGQAAAPRLEAFHAWGQGDELREVALRIRALLDEGARPESIAVVARTLAPRALALRRAFEEHGVPFSGGEEPPGAAPLQRRLGALLDTLREGGRTSADRWLDALGDGLVERREDVRAALRASGVARLSEVAALARADWLGRVEQVPLPHRGGIPDEPTPAARPARRMLAREHLLAAAAAAQRALDVVASWPDGEAIGAHAAQLERFGEALGVAPPAARHDEVEDPLGTAWARALEGLDELASLPTGPTRLELAQLLESALQSATARPLGGAGAGVRVLGAQEARGAVLEHLFLVGLERGAFPRPPRADPLLPDRAREALSAALLDLEPRERQHAEERWLFRALSAAAPRVTLSWLHADEEGREVAASPFVLRALEQAGVEARKLERRRERRAERPPRTAREIAVTTALTRPRADLEGALALALHEGLERFGDGLLPDGCSAGELSAARLEVLAEIEPDRRTREGRARVGLPGPWLGAAGVGALPSDGPVFVTRLEGLARCPWQGLLLNGLGLEPALDPLRDLPDLDALVLGNAVHGALQRLLDPGSPRRTRLDQALARDPSPLERPASIDAALGAAAQHALEDAGLRLPGLTQALVERARPLVEGALRLVGSGAAVLGAEVEGQAPAPIELAFRADLVVLEDDHPLLIDFKTGKPISDRKRQATRDRKLLADTRRGKRLQGMAYALSAAGAKGAYLFVDPDLDPAVARVEVDSGNELLLAAFEAAVARLGDAWQAGVLPARPEEPGGEANSACKWCHVRMACLRDDTGNRRRLLGVAKDAARDASAAPLAARIAALLGEDEPGSGDEEDPT